MRILLAKLASTVWRDAAVQSYCRHYSITYVLDLGQMEIQGPTASLPISSRVIHQNVRPKFGSVLPATYGADLNGVVIIKGTIAIVLGLLN